LIWDRACGENKEVMEKGACSSEGSSSKREKISSLHPPEFLQGHQDQYPIRPNLEICSKRKFSKRDDGYGKEWFPKKDPRS